MKRLMTICAATIGLCGANPAFAQHVAPVSTPFTATGAASLNGTPCTLTLNANTNAAGTGGTITGGTNTGAGICPLITIDSGATYTMASYSSAGNGSGTASLSGLVVRVGGAVACTQAGSITITITNNPTPPGGSTITVSGNIGTCTVSANLATPTVQAAP
nr:hypothetical protein [Sphingomonas sp. SCN 67-18]